ncbi:MAG: 4-alpha-glucanotransferase [Candidatus Omnitrophota bacterium]
MLQRGSGLLMHLSSLPSEFGIGDFGRSAYDFAKLLSDGGQRYWQMLPLNPTDGVYFESPYSSPAAFALNPLFISPIDFFEKGWLTKGDLGKKKIFPKDRVDFPKVRALKEILNRKAYESFRKEDHVKDGYEQFCMREDFWLDDYAMFMVLKEIFSGLRWDQWPLEMKERDPLALKGVKTKYHERIQFHKFLQFCAYEQWHGLREYCRGLKIKLIGDIPIYVNEDSADVWANPSFFKLDEKMRPRFVAGVPPDYFSTTGQLWGNPVYDWQRLKQDDYRWWMNRLRRQFELFDIVRIDHFRGFQAYWEIPATEKTAVIGQWTDGPQDNFFTKVCDEFKGLPLIGEDLGIITEDVTRLMERFEIPGMKVLQFAFGGDLKTHPYIPENYRENCVVYTGTHDNNTTRGWFVQDASPKDKQNLKEYLHKEPQEGTIAGDFIGLALRSKAVLSIIPFQDVLNLGEEARMNTPGTITGNWMWRYYPSDGDAKKVKLLNSLTKEAGRN